MTASALLSIIGSSLVGIGAAWVLRKKTHAAWLNILLSFSGAYLLGTVVIHLLPEIFHETTDTHTSSGHGTTATFILAGFFIQLLIVQLTRGLEHGHLHLHDHHSTGYVTGVVFGLSVHAFMEGIPLTNAGSAEVAPVFKAILVHKIPEAFALATVLFYSLRSKTVALILLAAFVAMTPLGTLTGAYVTENHMLTYNRLIAIVCGALIHISTTIIFEASGKAHRISMYKFAAILVGAGLALAGLYYE